MLSHAPQARELSEQERQGREDATAAVVKIQGVIEAVRVDLDQAQAAADRYLSLFLEPSLFEPHPSDDVTTLRKRWTLAPDQAEVFRAPFRNPLQFD